MRSGKDCDLCRLGYRPDGSICDCSFGAIRIAQEEESAHLRRGHREALPLDVIPTRYRNNTAADLAGLFDGEPLKLAALAHVIKWADPKREWADMKCESLFLHGPVGVGKTALSMLAMKLFMENGHRGQLIPWSEWIIRLGSLGFQQQGAEIDSLFRVPVLVLDDLGSQDRHDRRGNVEPETIFRAEKARAIINGRMNKNVPTIITTNLTVEQLGVQFGARMASRIAEDFAVMEVNGTDIRKTHGVNS